MARQAPSGFSREESWNGLPFSPPGDPSDPGAKSMSPVTPVLQVNGLSLIYLGSPKTL